MNRILIVHPADPSTDFLKEIYKDIKYEKLITDCDSAELYDEFAKPYDTVILLGHGTELGLYDKINHRYVVTPGHSLYLRDKFVIGIWCNANIYFEKFNVSNSFYTGMFISEIDEAIEYNMFLNKEKTTQHINESSALFARLMHDALQDSPTAVSVKNKIYNEYKNDNPIVIANREFMGFE